MKAFLLSAGKGERLRPLTDSIPKCMVPIQEVPLLEIWLDLCQRYGIHEVLVNTHAHAAVVQGYLLRHRRGIRMKITEEEVLLGSAGTLLANRSWVKDEQEFWIFYSDVLTNMNLAGMLEYHRCKNQIATIGVYEVANPKQCGIVAVDSDNIVKEFTEKPMNPRSNLAFSGILIATQAIFEVVPHKIPADIGFDVLPKLAGRMAAYPISDYLVDVGSPSSYENAQQTWPGLGVQTPA